MWSRRHAIPAALIATCTAGCQGVEGVEELTVAELAARLTGENPPVVFDVNGLKVRHEYGVIPGATLLVDAESYDVSALPADKARAIVFYCSSSWCSASKKAARRARDAGHTQVAVLPVGVKGWREAGQATEPAS